MNRLLVAAPLLAGLAGPAAAESLVLALSTENISINSNFTGTGITVFGAIERDAATVSRPDEYEIVVAMRGPAEDVVTRRKDPFLGLWINRASAEFAAVPSAYFVHATAPVDEITIPALLDRLQIGMSHIAFVPPSGRADGPEVAEFKAAYLRLKAQAGLYLEDFGSIRMPGANLFQTTLEVPANIPLGGYTITVYLFGSGTLLATAERRLEVSKIGFERIMFDLSRDRAPLYAAGIVAGALFIGWLAGVIFRRD